VTSRIPPVSSALHLKVQISNFEMFLRPAPGARNNLAEPGRAGKFKTAQRAAACAAPPAQAFRLHRASPSNPRNTPETSVEQFSESAVRTAEVGEIGDGFRPWSSYQAQIATNLPPKSFRGQVTNKIALCRYPDESVNRSPHFRRVRLPHFPVIRGPIP